MQLLITIASTLAMQVSSNPIPSAKYSMEALQVKTEASVSNYLIVPCHGIHSGAQSLAPGETSTTVKREHGYDGS